jgi:hypothetical protein
VSSPKISFIEGFRSVLKVEDNGGLKPSVDNNNHDEAQAQTEYSRNVNDHPVIKFILSLFYL